MGGVGVSGATEAGGKWYPRLVLLLGYAVWGAGVAVLGPLSEFAIENGVVGGKWTVAFLWLVAYPALIQLPLAAFYDRSWGRSRPAGRRPRFLRPKPVYGLLGAIAAAVVLSVVAMDALVDGSTDLGTAIGLALVVLLETALLYVYFPAVVTVGLVARWARPALRRFGWERDERDVPETTEETGAAGAGGESDTVPTADAGEEDGTGTASGTGGAGEASEADGGLRSVLSGERAQFVTVAGLVAVPVGVGVAVRNPQAGIGVASLLLTSYQIVS